MPRTDEECAMCCAYKKIFFDIRRVALLGALEASRKGTRRYAKVWI